MKNDNSTVVLEAKEERAKRRILSVIEECTELTILLPEEPLRMIVSLDNDIMINIIKMLIMEDLLNAVTIQPYSKVKGQQRIATEVAQKQQSSETSTQEPIKEDTKEDTSKHTTEASKEDNSKTSAEVSKEVFTQPATKKASKKQTIKDRVLLFMQQEARVLSNAEIIAAVGNNIKPENLSHNLVLLCEEGKIEKVARGYWKLKGIEGDAPTAKKGNKQAKLTSSEKAKKEEVKTEKITQDETIEQGGEKTTEQATKQENSQITEQQVLNLFTTGWQMTKEEIAEKLKVESKAVVKILSILVGSKKLQNEGEVYKLYKSPFGIFEDEEYKVLLDYIMEQNHFVEASIKNKFPQEAHKLEKLLKQMKPKYIKEQQDAKGSYCVYPKGRILYYVMQHPNANIGDIKNAFPTLSNQEISNAINIAIRNKELKRNIKTKTFVTVTM